MNSLIGASALRITRATANESAIPIMLLLSLAFAGGCHTGHTAWINVDSEPQGARVWEENIGDLGQTPLKAQLAWDCKWVFPNDTSIWCEKSRQLVLHAHVVGYDEQIRTIVVPKDATANVFFSLQPVAQPPAVRIFRTQVFVESDPQGAFVSVDGRSMGQTPGTIALEWSTAVRKTKTLVVRKTGYRDETKEVTPEDDRIVVVLQPLKARER